MLNFTLTSSAPAPLGLGADFRRTQVPPWPFELDADGAPTAEAVLGNIAQLPAEPIRSAAQGWGALFQLLPYGKDGAAAPAGRAELPAQAGWVRPAGEALAKNEDLQKATGVTGAHLVDLADRDPVLRAIAEWAGRAKDGAMDLRATNAAFGWFSVSLVLDGLKKQVKALGRDEGQKLLGQFAPMLVLILQAQTDRAASRERLAGKREDARVEAEAAALDARRAEVLRAYHAGEAVPRADLLDLAMSSLAWEDDGDEPTTAATTATPTTPAALRAPTAKGTLAARERRKKSR